MQKQFILKDEINNSFLSKDYLSPDYIFMPLFGHIEGIRQDDTVSKGQSLNKQVYSSVSGKVKGIKECQVLDRKVKCLAIQNNYKEKKIRLTKKLKKNLLLENLDNDLIDILNIDTKNLVLNTVSDESRIFNNSVIIDVYYQDILNALDILKDEFDYDNIFIIIKDTNRNNIDKFINIIGSFPEIKLITVPNVYPINNTSYINHLLNIDNSSIVKISDLYKIMYLFNHSIKCCEKYLTINYFDNSFLINVKIGTMVSELFKYLNIELKSNYSYFINGLIGGTKIDNINDLIVSESLEAIYITESKPLKSYNCIKCGNCARYCPVNIDPKYIKDHRNKVSQDYLNKCIKCGLCNYVCPAYIDLRKIIEGSDKNENS